MAEVKIHQNLQLQGSYPFLNKKVKDFWRTHFPFFKDSIQCKKEPRVYFFFSSSTTWAIYPEGLSVFAHVGTWSGLDKVSIKIQGLSRSVRTLQLSFCKVLKNKYCLVKVLPQTERLSSKGDIVRFCSQTLKLELLYKTPSLRLGKKR